MNNKDLSGKILLIGLATISLIYISIRVLTMVKEFILTIDPASFMYGNISAFSLMFLLYLLTKKKKV